MPVYRLVPRPLRQLQAHLVLRDMRRRMRRTSGSSERWAARRGLGEGGRHAHPSRNRGRLPAPRRVHPRRHRPARQAPGPGVAAGRCRHRPAVPWPRRHRLPARLGRRQRRRRVEDPTGADLDRRRRRRTPKGLLFRDVEAAAPAMSRCSRSARASASRIYRTTDGGKTWKLTFVNHAPAAFYDCMAIWPGGRHGLAMSDPVDGKFRIIATHDGGASWPVVDPAGCRRRVGRVRLRRQRHLPGHRRAAARRGWPRAARAARIFHSGDRGRTWTVPTRRSRRPTRAACSRWPSAPAPRPGRRRRLRGAGRRRGHVGVHAQQRPHVDQRRRPRRLPLRRRLGGPEPRRRRSRSARPAPTSPTTAAAPGRPSTTGTSTRCSARTTGPAGRAGWKARSRG